MPTRQKILLGILVLVVFVYVYMTFVKEPLEERQPTVLGAAPGTAPPGQQAAAVGGIPNEFFARKDTSITFTGTWGRDPFYREPGPDAVAPESEGIPGLVYQGLMGNTVLINGETYQFGDVISAQTIVTISEDYVVLEGPNNERTRLGLGGKP